MELPQAPPPAFDAHVASPGAKEFYDKIAAISAAPLDRRPLTAVSVVASSAAGGQRAVYVLTHVDVLPTFKD